MRQRHDEGQRRRDNATEGARKRRSGEEVKWASRDQVYARSGLHCFSRIIERVIRTLGRTSSDQRILAIHVFGRVQCRDRFIAQQASAHGECSSGYNERVADHSCRSVCSLLELASFVLSRVTV